MYSKKKGEREKFKKGGLEIQVSSTLSENTTDEN